MDKLSLSSGCSVVWLQLFLFCRQVRVIQTYWCPQSPDKLRPGPPPRHLLPSGPGAPFRLRLMSPVFSWASSVCACAQPCSCCPNLLTGLPGLTLLCQMITRLSLSPPLSWLNTARHCPAQGGHCSCLAWICLQSQPCGAAQLFLSPDPLAQASVKDLQLLYHQTSCVAMELRQG